MLTPPQKRTRYLATVWRQSRTQIFLTYSADAFAEFFPVAGEDVRAILGPEKVEFESNDQADEWGTRLDTLFEAMNEAGGSDAEGSAAPDS